MDFRSPDVAARDARWLERLEARGHRFHRFAHHPLCDAYAPEVLRVGGLVLCRGCTLATVGAVAGVLVGAGLRLGGLALPGPVAAALALPILYWAVMALYRRKQPPAPPRAPGAKLIRRGLPLFVAALGLGHALAAGAWGWAALSVAIVVLGRFSYCLRGANRSACDTCPERERRPSCSGYAPMLQRERAIQRLAARRLSNRPAVSGGAAARRAQPL